MTINLFHLTKLYVKYLLSKRVFINCILILLVFGFLLIPNLNANYITLYIGKRAVVPNEFWIGNLGAIFSNILITLLLPFIIIGEREKEILSHTFIYEDQSFLKRICINLYKIFAIYFISLVLLFSLNISIIVSNYINIRMLNYIFPVLYFSLSYLLILSTIVYFIEYLIKKKYIKHIYYILFFFLIMFYDKNLFDIIGMNELSIYMSEKKTNSHHFAIGYLLKSSNIELITFNEVPKTLFMYKKIIWILISFSIIYILSKFNISRQIYLNAENIGESIDLNDKPSIKNSDDKIILINDIIIKINTWQLIIKDFYLLVTAFSKRKKVLISLLFLTSWFIPLNLFNKLISLLFLSVLPTINSKFLSRLFFYDLSYYEQISPFSKVNIFISKFLVILVFYVILLLPLFFKIDNNMLLVLFSFISISLFQLISVNYFRNNLLADIFLIIIFASYFTGYPIINVLQL